MAGRDLGEADLACSGGQRRFVVGMAIAVQQHDGHRFHPTLARHCHAVDGRLQIQRTQHCAVGCDTLVDFEHLGIEHLGQDDVQLEQVRAGLVPDAQHVAEPRSGDEQSRHAAALQQRVGGHRGSHLHGPDPAGRQRFVARHIKQIGDRSRCGIVVAARVLAEQFVSDEAAVWPASYDVGERAPAVDPEVPGTS